MAITATDRGTGGDSTPASSFNACTALSGTMAVGSTGVLVISADNATGATTNLTVAANSYYTDSQGNFWYVRQAGVGGIANSIVEVNVLTSQLTHSLASSDTLTIGFNTSTTAKTWAFVEVVPDAGTMALISNTVPIQAGTDTASPSLLATAVTNGDLVIGYGGSETNDVWAGDADTTNGTWSTMQHTGTGSGATGASIITQTKVTTALGDQTYNPTLTSGTPSTRLGIIIFRQVDPKARVMAGAGNATTSGTITLILPMATGSLGVMAIAGDNSVTGGGTVQFSSSITDSKSNTWTRQQNAIVDPGAANAGSELAIYTSVLTTPLVVADTLTWSVSTTAVGVKVWAILEFAPTGAGAMTYVTGGNGGAGQAANASPSITTGSITSGDYVIGVLAAEAAGDITGDADTTNGTWSPITVSAFGTATATGQTIVMQWKKVTATATQSYDLSSTVGVIDSIAGWIQIHDSTPTGGLTASQKAAFFQMF